MTTQVCPHCFPIFKKSPSEVIDWTFEDMNEEEARVGSCILAVNNDMVHTYNNQIMAKLPLADVGVGEMAEHTYTSIDTPDTTLGIQLAPEECHSQCPTGLPPHQITLKVGCTIMLIKNLDVRRGRTNGTRLIVRKLNQRSIVVQKVGETDERSRFELGFMLLQHASTHGKPVFTRYQLPIRVAFAITINKSQGATLNRVGLILENPVFDHGQLFVALSRVRDRKSISIYSHMKADSRQTKCDTEKELLDEGLEEGHLMHPCRLRNNVYAKAVHAMLSPQELERLRTEEMADVNLEEEADDGTEPMDVGETGVGAQNVRIVHYEEGEMEE